MANTEENSEKIRKYGRKYCKDMKNTEETKLNSEKIWKIQKKSKLNSEKIGTIWKNIVK